MQCRRPKFNPWGRKIPWRREWLPTPLFLPGEFHGQGGLAGYSPWGWLEIHFYISVYSFIQQVFVDYLLLASMGWALFSAWKATAMNKIQSLLSRSLHFRREDVLISLGHHNKLAQNGWLAPTEIYVLTSLEPRNKGVSRAMLLLKALVENSWLWLHNLSLCLLHTAFPVCRLLCYLLPGHF